MEQFITRSLKMKFNFSCLALFSLLTFFACGLYAETDTAAIAKTECSKLQNMYSSVKSNYAKFKKDNDQNANKGKMVEMIEASKKVRDLEKKFNALPSTTPEAKLLKAKLLKQLQLGRELKPDEEAALDKDKK
jgi:hypothetical protein